MATEEHLKLSHEIKTVHKHLRDKTKKYGAKQAWLEHLKSRSKLMSYATAMMELATNHWEPNDQIAVMQASHRQQQRSRIMWSVNYCRDYFQQTELQTSLRNRELRILNELKVDTASIEKGFAIRTANQKIELLDVGSCYNPFSKFDEFEVTAIDIAPAVEDVFECDFLNVEVTNETHSIDGDKYKLTELNECAYDVIVFSLLLEYMPASEQRICCCEKAYRLLRNEGILIIITPDSKHVGANAKLMKTWRYALALMGFGRIKYEKLEHITCMVFRKCVSDEVSKRWARMHKEPYMDYKIEIPQDSTDDQTDADEVQLSADNIDQLSATKRKIVDLGTGECKSTLHPI